MAPNKGKARSTTDPQRGPSGRSRQRSPNTRDQIPDEYRSLLAELGESDLKHSDGSPRKKRRVDTTIDKPKVPESNEASGLQDGGRSSREQREQREVQTVELSSSSDEDSDFGFEDVDLGVSPSHTTKDVGAIQDLSISVATDNVTKRKTPSAGRPNKAHRLLMHRLHLLCLVGHCLFVNARCNNATAQGQLKLLLNPHTLSCLHPPPDYTQFRRGESFLDGLRQAMDAFRGRFVISASGLHRARWNSDGDGDFASAPAVDLSDFIDAAKDLTGSQDLGNQLFCALLRAVGVEARIVCSLQPLPFEYPTTSASIEKLIKPTVFVSAPNADSTPDPRSTDDAAHGTVNAGEGHPPTVRRRLGNPGFAVRQTRSPKVPSKPIRALDWPVFWVEAFNEAYQKWIAVDVVVTHTIGKPSQLEPPLSHALNQMSYVLAFEADGGARDVTRRYAKAYHAKTRRRRIESVSEADRAWWETLLRPFAPRRRRPRDRDQIEDAALAARDAREKMPTNVQDFRHHPYYALARHLRRHEAIFPLQPVGKVNVGTAAKPKMEDVFRRAHVQVCRSAEHWFRLGREVVDFERPIPMKTVPARRAKRSAAAVEDDEGACDTEGAETQVLYAESQTRLYLPPPVKRGRVPRNGFGNLDVYVPSMVPAGGSHVRHSLARRAAALLKVDAVDAVVGFEFKGRRGTAVVAGAVVAEQHADAIWAVIDGFEWELLEDQSRARSFEALRLWKRFLTGLRITERVASNYGPGRESGDADRPDEDRELNRDRNVETEGDGGGTGVDGNPLLTAGRFHIDDFKAKSSARSKRRKATSSDDDDQDDGNEDENYAESDSSEIIRKRHLSREDGGGGFLPEHVDDESSLFGETTLDGGFSNDQDDVGRGGFLPDDESIDEGVHHEEQGGGGFLFEDESANEATHHDEHRDDTASPRSSNPATGDQSVQHSYLSTDVEGLEVGPSDALDSAVSQPRGFDTQEAGLSSPGNGKGDEESADAEEAMNFTSSDIAGHVGGDESSSRAEGSGDDGSMISHDPDDEDLEPDWLSDCMDDS